jgi:hypothetical protein
MPPIGPTRPSGAISPVPATISSSVSEPGVNVS